MALGINELSKELNIPFENLLAGIAREEICVLLSLTDYGRYLWLCSPDDFGAEVYRNKVNRRIRFAYCEESRLSASPEITPGATFSKKLCEDILESIRGENGKDSINGRISDKGQISLDIRVEGMRVPVTIEIFPISSPTIKPVSKPVKLLRMDEEFTLLHYPPEAEVAAGLCKIVTELEFIDDISVYQKVFDEIMSMPLDGRTVWSGMKSSLKESNVIIDEDLLQTVKSYSASKYMAKLWNNYNKRQNNSSSDWKKIVTAIGVFLSPIWEALMEERPFVGDWMPELGRFL